MRLKQSDTRSRESAARHVRAPLVAKVRVESLPNLLSARTSGLLTGASTKKVCHNKLGRPHKWARERLLRFGYLWWGIYLHAFKSIHAFDWIAGAAPSMQ